MARVATKEIDDAADVITEFALKDEAVARLLTEMGPEFASKVSDRNELHKAILKMLKAREPAANRQSEARRLADSVASDPSYVERSAELGNARLLDLCLQQLEAEEREVKAKAQVMKATIQQDEECLRIIAAMHPSKRLMFRSEHKILVACERCVL